MMWYGMFATTSYGVGTRCTRSWSSASPSTIRSAPASSSSGNVSRSSATSPRSSSTAVTCAPGREQPAGEEPQPGPDLQHAPLRRRVGLAQDPLEHVDVGEEVLRQVVAGPQPGVAEAALDVARVQAQVAGARRRRSSGERQRRPRVEVQAGAHAGREPPGARGADHRPVVGAQARGAG